VTTHKTTAWVASQASQLPPFSMTRALPTELWTREDLGVQHDSGTEDESEQSEDSNAPQISAAQERDPIARIASDYFSQISAPSRTSSNVFSALIPPLTAEEYALALPKPKPLQSSICSESLRAPLLSRFFHELEEGFNLLFYGLGSKRVLINQFAVECSRSGHVVVVNGFQFDFSIRDMLSAIENIPEISSLPLSAAGVENQTRRICDFFSRPSSTPRLYIIIHNIDALPFRASRTKSCLSLLALNPRIHLIASVDRINSPFLWSSTELSTRKHSEQGKVPSRGFAWLMHDLTTLLPYDVELSHADRSSILGAHDGKRKQKETVGAVTQIGALMTETAAMHILASVTQKAKKLFTLMGNKQLERIEETGDPALDDLQHLALGYDMLFNLARDNFIATNDTSLRSLLGEFRDHGLVLVAPGDSGSGEVLWIPMRKERLSKILQSLQTEH
jgi:origin recognition complex subunit 2